MEPHGTKQVQREDSQRLREALRGVFQRSSVIPIETTPPVPGHALDGYRPRPVSRTSQSSPGHAPNPNPDHAPTPRPRPSAESSLGKTPSSPPHPHFIPRLNCRPLSSGASCLPDGAIKRYCSSSKMLEADRSLPCVARKWGLPGIGLCVLSLFRIFPPVSLLWAARAMHPGSRRSHGTGKWRRLPRDPRPEVGAAAQCEGGPYLARAGPRAPCSGRASPHPLNAHALRFF